jgi:hypothetical protein
MERLPKITFDDAKTAYESVDTYAREEIINNLFLVADICKQTREHPPFIYWTLFRGVFSGIDITDFLNINEPTQFVYESIYYMARFFLANGRSA